MTLRPSLLLALVVLLTACAPGAGLPPLPAASESAYRLGPGDTVRIVTFGEEQLTGEFRVSDTGTIALPLAGPVTAAGLSPPELEKAVAARLKNAALLQDPSVSAEVTAYRPVFVLGEVNKPGQYPYQPGMTLVTAVAVAGGFTYRAIDDYGSIVRTIGGTAVEGKAMRQSYVQPGDVITIFERRF